MSVFDKEGHEDFILTGLCETFLCTLRSTTLFPSWKPMFESDNFSRVELSNENWKPADPSVSILSDIDEPIERQHMFIYFWQMTGLI